MKHIVIATFAGDTRYLRKDGTWRGARTLAHPFESKARAERAARHSALQGWTVTTKPAEETDHAER